jgi:hypothetical protein
MADAWQEPTAQRWIRQVLDDMVPKMEDSAVVMSIVPDDRTGDVKFWVELGASIMLNKPLIAVVLGDAPVPSKLALVADEIVRLDRGVDADGSAKVAAAFERVMRMRR